MAEPEVKHLGLPIFFSINKVHFFFNVVNASPSKLVGLA